MKKKFLNRIVLAAGMILLGILYAPFSAFAEDATTDNMIFQLDKNSKEAQFKGLTSSVTNLTLPEKIYEISFTATITGYSWSPYNNKWNEGYLESQNEGFEYATTEEIPSQTVTQFQIYQDGSYKDVDYDPGNNRPDGVTKYRKIVKTYKSTEMYNVTGISMDWRTKDSLDEVETISIPAAVNSIDFGSVCLRGLVRYDVDPANQSYCSEDGVLFNKEKTALVKFPLAKRCDYRYKIPDTVTEIQRFAFRDYDPSGSDPIMHDYYIEFPQGLASIAAQAFDFVHFDVFDLSRVSENAINDWSTDNSGGAPFCRCSGSQIVFPSATTRISCLANRFYRFSGLEAVVLPKTLPSRAFVPGGPEGINIFNVDTLKEILDLDGNYFKNDYFEFDGIALWDRVNSEFLRCMPGYKPSNPKDPESPYYNYELKGAKSIYPLAFLGCKNLENLIIDEGPKILLYGTLNGCDNLKTITLPESMSYIGYGSLNVPNFAKLKIKNPNMVFGYYSTAFGEDRGESPEDLTFDIEIPCNFDKSTFFDYNILGIKIDPDDDNYFIIDRSSKRTSFTHIHDLYYDPEYENEDGSKGATICRACGKIITVPDHKCKYVKATCKHPAHCNICGKIKTKPDLRLNPDGHLLKSAPGGNLQCVICGKDFDFSN